MKRLTLVAVFSLIAVLSSAQAASPVREAFGRALSLLEQNKPKAAADFWADNAGKFRGDSLLVSADVELARAFLGGGHLAEAEALLGDAELALEDFRSESAWWYGKRGQVSATKAFLYSSMNDYDSVRICASDAKIAYEHVLYRGEEYAFALSVLSLSALADGRPVLARTFVGEAVFLVYQAMMSSTDAAEYPYFSLVFRNMGFVETALGYYENAINTFESLKALNRQWGLDDPNVDLYLGMAYVGNGDYGKAVDVLTPFYQDCTLRRQRIVSGVNLLYSKYRLGQDDVRQLACDIVGLQTENVSRMFSFMSDREKERWWLSNENGIISVADWILLKSGAEGVGGMIAGNEIFSRGLLLRSSNRLRQAALNSSDKEVSGSYASLEDLRAKWSVTTDSKEQAALEKRIAALEKRLQRKLNLPAGDVSSWKDVASALGDRETAVEFMRFGDLMGDSEAEYYAMIIRKGDSEPRIIRLFDESALAELLGNPSGSRIDRYVDELYSTGKPQSRGDRLYELIWSALEKEVKGCRTVYYSPAGLLNSISLQALSDGKQHLGQRYVMHQVSSIGEIPRIKAAVPATEGRAVVYGGVKYDADESELILASRSYPKDERSERFEDGVGDVRSGWSPLPGTETEAEEVSSLLAGRGYDVTTVSGIKANEESFKSLSGRDVSILHVATHGFFLRDRKDVRKNPFLSSLLSGRDGTDPMLRSGLLFAGANRAWTGKQDIVGVEDGILTAREIAALNLSGVKLVVLSACQTGLGDVKADEGVYGLQRAFKLAGVETLVMSLWEVDDRATSLLMRSFYEEYLGGKPKDVAFRDAVESVRKYKDADGSEPFSSPYYWAAFIMLD